MATVDPKKTLAALMVLQKLDNEVWRLRRRIQETPQLLERRAERFRQADAKVEGVKARIQEAKKQVGLFELEIKVRETEVQKIQGAQGQSRTNEEFRAFNEHVNRLRKENRAVEDRILELMTQLETLDLELAETSSTRDSHKKEVDADLVQWKKDEAEYQDELAKRTAERNEYARTIPPGPLSTYDRLLKARDGKAVVTADQRSCGGCQMSVTPNDFTRLHTIGDLVYCRSCDRILYLSEVMAAAAR